MASVKATPGPRLNERSIRVRPHAPMHGPAGYLVTASNEISFQTRIFTLTREGADLVRDALWLMAKADLAIDTILREGR